MGYLNDKIKKLELEVDSLITTLTALGAKVESKYIKPITQIGQETDKATIRGVPPITGAGASMGGGLVWNDIDLQIPPCNVKPGLPTKGYNQHTHSEFAGGALDVNSLELIEYDLSDYNIHCRQSQANPPVLKDSKGIDKYSTLEDNFVWDEFSQKWRFYCVYRD